MPSSTPYLLGIDLGGSSVKAAVLTPEGGMITEANRAFDVDRPLQFARVVRDVARELIAAQGGDLRAVGMSAPGLPAGDGRSIAYLPNRLPGIEGLNWSEFLGLGRSVPLLNDAHAALLGETWQGAARNRTNVVLLTLGTGVGGAAMVDGRLLRGHVGKAGHLGHVSLDPNGPPDICGTPGSLELAIGNATIQERSQGRFATTHALIQAHQAGDADASNIWLLSVRALAAAIASLTNVLDPEVVVIGGGIAAAGDALFEPLRSMVATMEWRIGGHAVTLVPALLGDKAGAVGAAHHAQTLATGAGG
jgi:glucokinase